VTQESTSTSAGLALALALGLTAAARGDAPPDADADAAFRAALAQAATDPRRARADLEALGAATPPTRWTDDAWAEAARLAEAASDYPGAAHDLDQVIAHGDDPLLVARARAARARLAAITGADGASAAVAARHDALRAALLHADDPRPTLAALADLLAAAPAYPRATDARLELAAGWERAGDAAAAAVVLDQAIAAAPTAADRRRARLAGVRLALRRGELTIAAAAIDALAADSDTDRALLAALRDELATASRRSRWRTAVIAGLALLTTLAALALRRAHRGWRPALRALARPPGEVLYATPVALVLALAATAGNPLVGRAVRTIALGGLAIAWLTGALTAAAPRRAHTVVHATLAALAAAGVVYLALGRDHLLDLVLETWRAGPAAR
jgi:hypothetical protein